MTTPFLRGFVSRADMGLRTPRSISRNIRPESGGMAVHWGGAGSAPSLHTSCLKRWKSWQDFHMDSRGWTDIAYNFGYCNHGYALAGRGIGVRSGAQGTTFGNDHFYAACWVGGAQSEPTELALGALLWLIQEVRKGGAGLRVKPHGWFKSTSCPGPNLRSFIVDYDDKEMTMARFKDVPIDHTHHDGIQWLAEQGITKGTNPPKNDLFSPSRLLTRAEFATMLKRYHDKQPK